MSLTSYRAAPPRDDVGRVEGLWRKCNWGKADLSKILGGRGCGVELVGAGRGRGRARHDGAGRRPRGRNRSGMMRGNGCRRVRGGLCGWGRVNDRAIAADRRPVATILAACCFSNHLTPWCSGGPDPGLSPRPVRRPSHHAPSEGTLIAAIVAACRRAARYCAT